MAVTGTIPFTKAQAANEVTKGTILAATRINPVTLGGLLTENIERHKPQEQRNSLIRNYRSFQVKRWVDLTVTSSPTFEDLAWYGYAFMRGTPSTPATNVTAKDYVFTPTVAADDLKTVCWEVGDDTQAYAVPYSVGSKFELQVTAGAAASFTATYLAQRATPVSFTSSLSDRVTEDVNGALFTSTIDATTIGSTSITNVTDFKFTLDNHQTQIWTGDGNIYPGDAYRSEPRSATLEATLIFNSTTEYLSFTADTGRKIRFTIAGSAIAGSVAATTKKLTLDWYGKWDTAPITDQNGIHVVKFTGESIYDATAALDWSFTIRLPVSTSVPL
jgi:hypothetical protein